MDSSKKLTYEEEGENAELALEEGERTGHTERRCLRCGGEFIFHVTPSGYSIKCARENCFVLTARGI
jgi:hypothetical protein